MLHRGTQLACFVQPVLICCRPPGARRTNKSLKFTAWAFPIKNKPNSNGLQPNSKRNRIAMASNGICAATPHYTPLKAKYANMNVLLKLCQGNHMRKRIQCCLWQQQLGASTQWHFSNLRRRHTFYFRLTLLYHTLQGILRVSIHVISSCCQS